MANITGGDGGVILKWKCHCHEERGTKCPAADMSGPYTTPYQDITSYRITACMACNLASELNSLNCRQTVNMDIIYWRNIEILCVARSFCCATLSCGGCPSVCPSVTFMYCAKTSKHIPKLLLLLGSHTILVFFVPNRMTVLRWMDPPNGAVECR